MRNKIWIMNHYASEMFRDKAGRHYWFARKLKERGYSPIVFCASTYHSKKDGIAMGKARYTIKTDEKIPYVFVKTHPSLGNGLGRIWNMVYFYLNLFPVSKEIKKRYDKPDIILASSVHPLTMVAGVQIARKFGIPCICEVRDLWPEAIFSFGKVKEKSIFGKLLIAGEHWIYKNANALIFTKEGDTDYLKERKWTTEQGGDIPLDKCHYINNGVNLKVFDWSVKNEQLEDDDLKKDIFTVTYAGSLRPVNDVGKILDCAKILKDRQDIRFLIYGDGIQREMLQKRIIDENITNVAMKGSVDRKYIPYILSKSSVNILNYSQEKYNWSRGNSSNKLFEYMASGKPVISTVRMGYDIIERYGCGFSLEHDTAEKLAEAILKIKVLPKEYYARLCKASREGANDFDYDVLCAKLVQVIENA